MQDGGSKLAGQMTTLDVVWRHNQHNGIMWSLYEIIHISTAVVDESKEWSSQRIFIFKHLERGSLKNLGFNGSRTSDLRDTGEMLYQLSS